MINAEFLQSYFHADYHGANSIIQEVLEPIFGKAELNDQSIISTATDRTKAMAANIKDARHVATLWPIGSDESIKVFDITIEDRCHIHIARQGIQHLVREWVDRFEGAFMIFHYTNTEGRSWRLSYMEKRSKNADSTSAKRYTYLCGELYPCRTIAERFSKLSPDNINATILEEAFSAEALSDEFFVEYKNFYDDFVNYVTNDGKMFARFKQYAKDDEDQAKKSVRDYIKKLMGRLVFIQFLQKKAWLNNDLHYMLSLFNESSERQKADYLDNVLEPLFFGIFNTKPEDRVQLFSENKWDKALLEKWNAFPYLNGGLFECDELDELRLPIPSYFFSNPEHKDHIRKPTDEYYDDACGIFDFFERYNFTIDESDPLDLEVGVDPEMLGKIFENLLEDNKDKGAFYTPKEIVQYMCKESLIAYLVSESKKKNEASKQSQANFEEAIRAFVNDPEMTVTRIGRYTEKQLDDLLDSLISVKICDPAIGSGAFPMGLLNLLVNCREALNKALGIGVPRYALKHDIILNNIYGVDIEKGAIDIARLRFWLSIVVDLETPQALPNFDYKFMQGNSLLEQYDGVDLSNMFATEEETNKKIKGKNVGVAPLIIFDEEQIPRTILQEKMNRYFSMGGDGDKHKMRQEMNKSVVDLVRGKTPGKTILHEKLSNIDVSANEHFFLWHTWFADVFKNGGFDIVIGNPPYLFLSGKGSPVQKLRNLGKHQEADVLQALFDSYKRNFPEASQGCCDLYKWFFALAAHIVKRNGIISYITPDTYFNMPKYRDIRRLLFSNQILKLIDLGFHVFKAPCVSSSVIVLQKNAICSTSVDLADIKSILTFENRQLLDYFISEFQQPIAIRDFNICAYKNPIAEAIYTDASEKYVPINTYVDFIEGEHDIQIVSDAISTNWKSGYVPVLIDKNISKYSYIEMGYVPSTIEISNTHMGDRCILRKTGDTIVVAIPHNIEPAIAHQNTYVVKAVEAYEGPMAFWFGFLNSKMMTFLYQNGIYGQKGRTMAQFRKYALAILPVPTNILSIQNKVLENVSHILAAKQSNPSADTSALEIQIDELVYDLYGLTEEEKEIIRKS